jgi:superoxide dismutase
VPTSPEPPCFPNLARGLTGISGRALASHVRVYEAAWRELRSIRQERPKLAWTAPAGAAAGADAASVQRLLETSVRDLDLKITGKLKACLDQLRGELEQKGISWAPSYYLGDDDFWTTDRATSVNVPWFLANDLLWWLVNDQTTRYTHDELMMVLRHETGHAIGYAFELWRRPDWGTTFGDFDAPYRDDYVPDPKSTDFVRHLHRAGDNEEAHYAQKHPDEDWAETFATWLGSTDWSTVYAQWPGALAKLNYVKRLVEVDGAAYGKPKNTRVGQRVPYKTLKYLVGEYLGVRPLGEWSPRSALLQREAFVLSDVRLHEVYFAALRRGAQLSLAASNNSPGPLFGAAVRAAFGSYDAWAEDARAVCGSPGAWLLVAWDYADRTLRNLLVGEGGAGTPAGFPPVLAVCLHEHAYAPDYGDRRDLYLGAVFAGIDWGVVDRRLEIAGAPAAT